MQNNLLQKGFVRDRTAPLGVNRYEKKGIDYYFSVTLSEDGERTLYGCFLFNQHDMGNFRKRKFDGEVTIAELVAIMDKNNHDIPSMVREFPYVQPTI